MKRSRTRCAVYRCWDAGGVLLYVGQSVDPEKRWRQHARSSQWAELVDRREVTWYRDYPRAAQAEAVAIRDEAPLHNVQTESRWHGSRWLRRRRKPDYTAVRKPAPAAPARSTAWTWSGWVALAVGAAAVLIDPQRDAVQRAATAVGLPAISTWLLAIALLSVNWGAMVAGSALLRGSRSTAGWLALLTWAAAWSAGFGVTFGWPAAGIGALAVVTPWAASRALRPPRLSKIRPLVVPTGRGGRTRPAPRMPHRPSTVEHGLKGQRAHKFVLEYIAEHGNPPTGAEVDAHVGGSSTGRAVLRKMRESGELDDAERAASA